MDGRISCSRLVKRQWSVSPYVFPFLVVMLVLISAVGYSQRRKNRSDDD